MLRPGTPAGIILFQSTLLIGAPLPGSSPSGAPNNVGEALGRISTIEYPAGTLRVAVAHDPIAEVPSRAPADRDRMYFRITVEGEGLLLQNPGVQFFMRHT